MKKLLLLLLCVPLLFSCGEKNEENKDEGSLTKEITQKMIDDGYTGKGTFYYEGGEILDIIFSGTYVGEFNDGKFHGKGTYNMGDGFTYVGEFRNNNFHGQGTFNMNDVAKYVGEWVNGRRHGQGTETYDFETYNLGTEDDPMAVPIMYEGSWKRGQYLIGTLTFDNGDKYVGEFRDSFQHGQGTYTYSDGKVEKGLWDMDEFIGEK